MSDIERAEQFITDGYTLALVCGDSVYKSRERGVKPLLELIDTGADYSDYSAADKVVGRGAALLYAYLSVKSVYAEVVSSEALSVLTRYNISIKYATLVPRIENRDKTGFCPIEEATLGIDFPQEALIAVKEALSRLREKGGRT